MSDEAWLLIWLMQSIWSYGQSNWTLLPAQRFPSQSPTPDQPSAYPPCPYYLPILVSRLQCGSGFLQSFHGFLQT